MFNTIIFYILIKKCQVIFLRKQFFDSNYKKENSVQHEILRKSNFRKLEDVI